MLVYAEKYIKLQLSTIVIDDSYQTIVDCCFKADIKQKVTKSNKKEDDKKRNKVIKQKLLRKKIVEMINEIIKEIIIKIKQKIIIEMI